MTIKHLLCLFYSFFFISLLNKVGAQVNTRDSLALVDLYNSTNGTKWKNNTNWLSAQPIATWYGVTVRNNRVVGLGFSYNRMSGSLPATLGNLDSLQALSLTTNYTSLTGDIPASIGNLRRLVTLDLNTNGFTGSIPSSIGGIDSLQTLNLSNNSLSGTLPASMGKLKKLVTFDASYNRAGIGHISGNGVSGAIPDSLAYCKSLSLVNLSYNSLTGSLPSTFSKMANLTTLELFNNQLSGTLTNVFGDSSHLAALNLAANLYSGNVPTFFSKLTHLATLALSNNQFTGPVPSALANAKSLVFLDLSFNQLTGTIPAGLNKLPLLISLNLGSNQLRGSLPYLFKNYTLANINLDVSHNSLTVNQNPQYHGSQVRGIFNFAYNRFTFDGLEYFNEKYYTVNDAPQAELLVHLHNNKLAVSAGGTLSRNTYKWYKAGIANPVTITGDSTYQPASSGSYFVNVTNSSVPFLTLMSDTVNYNVAGINNGSTITVSIYPNPAKRMLSVNGLNDKTDLKLTIADMSGNVWLSAMSREQTTVKFDISRLKPGNYLLNVNDNKEIKTIQFVKE